MINYREINKKFYVFQETETQLLSITDGAYANKSDAGAMYVGREYKTETQAKRAVRYYSNK